MDGKDKALIEAYHYFKKLGLDILPTASTLLGMVRDGRPIGGIFEVDFMAEDMTEEMMKRWDKDGYKKSKEGGVKEHTIYHHDYEGLPRIEVQGVYIIGNYAVKNITSDKICVWPKEVYGTKDKWQKFNWEGIDWNLPANPEKWLAMYYGDPDWKTPQGFNWGNAHNLMIWEEFEKKL